MASLPNDHPAVADLRTAIDDLVKIALAKGRVEMQERVAIYHRRHIAELKDACAKAWPEVTPDLGLHALKVHEESLRDILALRTED